MVLPAEPTFPVDGAPDEPCELDDEPDIPVVPPDEPPEAGFVVGFDDSVLLFVVVPSAAGDGMPVI